MKFRVLNPIFDTKTEVSYRVGDMYEASDKRIEEIKANLESQGGFGLYLEEIENVGDIKTPTETGKEGKEVKE